MRPTAWFVLLLLLSGCLGGRAAPHGSLTTITPSLDARPTETRVAEGPGLIEGVVVDDEHRPLADAWVDVYRRKTDVFFQLNLKTDDNGRFTVRGLAAGEFIVYVGKDGFQDDAARLLLVEDGRTTFFRWILAPAPIKEPFKETKSFRTIFGSYLCPRIGPDPVEAVCKGAYLTSGGLAAEYPVDEKNQTQLENVIVEVEWSATLPAACNAGIRVHVYSPDQARPTPADAASSSNPFHWDNGDQVQSPIQLRINRTGADAFALQSPTRVGLNQQRNLTVHGDWRVEVEPFDQDPFGPAVGFSCFVEQSVQTYTSFFHGLPAPAGWSALKP